MTMSSYQGSERELLVQRSIRRAMTCIRSGSYGRAVAHLSILMTLRPDLKAEFQSSFIFSLERYSRQLKAKQKWKDLFQCFEHALEIFPTCEAIHHALGVHLTELGLTESAQQCFQQALIYNPRFIPARVSLENLKTNLLERWHFQMLNDQVRNSAFQRAIVNAAEAGYDSVLDIGTGTGLFSMIAATSGIKTVYACEVSSVLCQVATRVLEENGLKERVELLKKLSNNVQLPGDLPNRVSLVVTETFDSGLFGEHILQTLHHAWNSLLLPPNPALQLGAHEAQNVANGGESTESKDCGTKRAVISDAREALNCRPIQYGKVIPHCATVWGCLIECPKVRNSEIFQTKHIDALDFTHLLICPLVDSQDPYLAEKLTVVKDGFRTLSSPFEMLRVNFCSPQEIDRLLQGVCHTFMVSCANPGVLDAVAMWFDLHLDESISLSTDPYSGSCWQQALYPVSANDLKGLSHDVAIGDQVEVSTLCKGHLSVQCVNITSYDSRPAAGHANETVGLSRYTVHVDRQSLLFLNDEVALSAVIGALRKVIDEHGCSSIIDAGRFPCFGFLALHYGAEKAFFLTEALRPQVLVLADHWGFSHDRVVAASLEELSDQHDNRWDVLVIDVVDISGLLSSHIIEDIALLRFSCLHPSTVILPYKFCVYGVLTESFELLEQTCVVDNDRTLGFRIAEYINEFRTTTQQDLQLSTLSHKKLSENFKLFEVDFCCPSTSDQIPTFLCTQGSCLVRATESGMLTALAYWFTLHYSPTHAVDTSDPATRWCQAAVVVEPVIRVHEGNLLEIAYHCENSCIFLAVKDVQDIQK